MTSAAFVAWILPNKKPFCQVQPHISEPVAQHHCCRGLLDQHCAFHGTDALGRLCLGRTWDSGATAARSPAELWTERNEVEASGTRPKELIMNINSLSSVSRCFTPRIGLS